MQKAKFNHCIEFVNKNLFKQGVYTQMYYLLKWVVVDKMFIFFFN